MTAKTSKVPSSAKNDEFAIFKDQENILLDLPPTEDLLNHYKTKCSIYQQNFQSVIERLERLELGIKEKSLLEKQNRIYEAQISELQSTLGDTEALLTVERQQSQQLALHIDMLKQQCRLYQERIDLLLSLNGSSRSSADTKQDSVFPDAEKFQRLLNEQASLLMEERTILKKEHEIRQRKFENETKSLREKVANLEKQLFDTTRHLVQLKNFSHPELDERVFSKFLVTSAESENAEQEKVIGHCTIQSFKKMKKKTEEMQYQVETYHKKNAQQTAIIQQLTDQLKTIQENAQTQKNKYQVQMERLREQISNLDKRRLNEAAGFRSEILILKEELQRTQKQLCFLTLRKFE